jgi:hypothetical protein
MPGQQLRKRVLRYPARVILSGLMSLAVMVLERRLGKALRSKAGPGQVQTGT